MSLWTLQLYKSKSMERLICKWARPFQNAFKRNIRIQISAWCWKEFHDQQGDINKKLTSFRILKQIENDECQKVEPGFKYPKRIKWRWRRCEGIHRISIWYWFRMDFRFVTVCVACVRQKLVWCGPFVGRRCSVIIISFRFPLERPVNEQPIFYIGIYIWISVM